VSNRFALPFRTVFGDGTGDKVDNDEEVAEEEEEEEEEEEVDKEEDGLLSLLFSGRLLLCAVALLVDGDTREMEERCWNPPPEGTCPERVALPFKGESVLAPEGPPPPPPSSDPAALRTTAALVARDAVTW